MTKIYTVNALCGSGKTYAAIRYAIKRAKFGEKIAIIQPSKDLIRQSYERLSCGRGRAIRQHWCQTH